MENGLASCKKIFIDIVDCLSRLHIIIQLPLDYILFLRVLGCLSSLMFYFLCLAISHFFKGFPILVNSSIHVKTALKSNQKIFMDVVGCLLHLSYVSAFYLLSQSHYKSRSIVVFEGRLFILLISA